MHPDLDFELTDTGAPDPTFGRFTNTGTPPALRFFQYQAGGYAATIHDPAAFGSSEIDIDFTNGDAITIGIVAPNSVPQLPGGRVSFFAGFESSRPIFTSDRLPTNTALGPGSFDQSTVFVDTSPGFTQAFGNTVTSLKVTPLPEPSGSALTIAGFLTLLGMATQRARQPAHARCLAPPSGIETTTLGQWPGASARLRQGRSV